MGERVCFSVSWRSTRDLVLGVGANGERTPLRVQYAGQKNPAAADKQ